MTHIATSPQLYVIATGKTGTIVTSPDATTWTVQTSGVSVNLRSACSSPYQAYKFVCGDSGTILLCGACTQLGGVTQLAGINSWTAQSSGTGQNLNSIFCNGSTVVAVGDNGTITTATVTENLSPAGSGITVGSFSVQTVGTYKLRSLKNNSTLGLFIAVGDHGTILTSPDGTTWTTRTSPNTKDLYGVASNIGAAHLVAIASDGTTIKSSDGITWS